jgi:hypothetical protein
LSGPGSGPRLERAQTWNIEAERGATDAKLTTPVDPMLLM